MPIWQPAQITMRFNDTAVISEQIQVQPRGEFRKTQCDIASLMLNFKNPTSPKLAALKKLKLVGGCQSGSVAEEILLKEYLVYKLYNILSIMSFRVRLLHVTYKDSKSKGKGYSQYAFLIEDMKDVADRNNCVEIKGQDYATESTHRQQITFVSLFQYMIGNIDWSVLKYHNMKLMAPKTDTLSSPYPIPYDFDYCGLVDAAYAIPAEEFGIASVRDRVYRGFPRTMEELQEAIEVFKERKERLKLTINNFPLLGARCKKDMLKYLEDFYDVIDDKRSVRSTFIINARKK